MAMSQAVMAKLDQREVPRDEVHYRTRATTADGRSLQVLVVNMSARGLMARCEAPLSEGDRVRVRIPVLGTIGGEVRWALGGRFGCELDQMIPLSDYMLVLATMVEQT